ncbi:Catechol oxidase [Zostera marina]|uniref:Catechol oxidase n=1 Tax=Zostera marina TaxID=29655 RepID=A0A0K9PD68_ZOSMR|nr:Catechol oxidase [Zostera marina]
MSSIPFHCSPNMQLLSTRSFCNPLSFPTSKITTRKHSTRVSPVCANNKGSGNVDRREMLLGLGGLSASGLVYPNKTIGAPIQAPNINQCSLPTTQPNDVPLDCCPPVLSDVVDFVPKTPTRIRVRPAAHNMTKEQIEKYEEATRLMKALPDDDPRSFIQQSNVHCAYCDAAYDQVGFPDLELQIHNNWLFFPFHRWQMYFYEQILGKLIGDKDFEMPFWNWDHPNGMTMPAIFANKNSPLFHQKRDQRHVPPVILDLNFEADTEFPDQERIDKNLTIMYKYMVTNAYPPIKFFGSKYVAGDDSENTEAGSVEMVPHSAIHNWVGDPDQPQQEDMGALYSSGNDPAFYCHHTNVDRLWDVWMKLDPKRNKNLTDPDWLESSFLFYNEDAVPVRVKTKDCLEASLLGYRYENVDIPWMATKPTSGAPSPLSPKQRRVINEPKFPVTLKTAISTTVKRPRKGRSKKEKEDEKEVLVLEGIEYDCGMFLTMDVYVNTADPDTIKPGSSELAGSFVNLPHKHKHRNRNKKKPGIMTSRLSLNISDLLDETNADDDDDILVTLVPRNGKGAISVKSLSVKFVRD